MQAKLGGMMKLQESFFFNRKNMMMAELAKGGWDPIQVANFLDNVGVADEKPDKVDGAMRAPGYVNPMRLGF
jgi:hypothetical protein